MKFPSQQQSTLILPIISRAKEKKEKEEFKKVSILLQILLQRIAKIQTVAFSWKRKETLNPNILVASERKSAKAAR